MRSWYTIRALAESAEVAIYDEIGAFGVSAKTFLDEIGALPNEQRITLRINSPGGSVFDAVAIHNALKRHEGPVTVWIDGIAASAASYPFTYSPDEVTDLGALPAPQYWDAKHRLRDWAESLVAAHPTDTLAMLKDISNTITRDIRYQSRETEGTQGPLETLDRGWGTCRDFAVLFAEAVRTLGLAARLVSGYLFNPGGELAGSTDTGATHAWTEVFIPGAGWIPFDPTNRSVGSANLTPLAVARSVHQISPVSASSRGRNGDFLGLDVTVDVRT